MSDLVNQIAIFIESLVLAIGYPGIFLIMLLENLIPPIPTDPLLPFAGILAAQGLMTVIGVWISAVAGALVGSLALYMLGRQAGEPFVRGLVRRYGRWLQIDEPALDRTFRLANKYGVLFVFVGRSIPVLRSAVSLTAGMSRMSLPAFALLSGLNSLLVTGFWIFAGYFLGENWGAALGFIDRFEPILTPLLIVAAVLLVAGLIARRLRWLGRGRAAAPAESAREG
ncbi:MAG: DedA family protein [Chloroflexota bacterium]|nr:DedA family protein [Chloroflexota bacterium]